MSMIYKVIKFNSKGSGLTYVGQKDVYPLSDASLGYGYSASGGVGDNVGHIALETSYFLPHPNTDTSPGIDQQALFDLNAHLLDLVTKKMSADTITIMEVTTTDDPANFKVISQIEHPSALVRVSERNNSWYVINSDDATLSTIPSGGTDATNKTKLDYKNKQVNGTS